MGRKNGRKKDFKSLNLGNKVRSDPGKSGDVCESDRRKERDKSGNTNLEQESGISSIGSPHTPSNTPDSINSFCVLGATPVKTSIEEVSCGDDTPDCTNGNQDLALSQKNQDATINLQLDGQNNNKVLVVSNEEVKDYNENNNSPLGSNERLLPEDENDTSSNVQETTFASEESFVTAENETETYKSNGKPKSDDSILTDSDSIRFNASKGSIYTHDDQQDVSLQNEQSSSKEGSTDTLVKLDEENKIIEITNTNTPEASKHNEDDSNQLLNSSEPLISASFTSGNSPKEISRESIDSKSSRILQKVCFSAIDTSEGEELVYKTSSCNPSQKNSKGKKVSLCLTALSCAVFFGSLTCSFLGKPLISDQKGNLILLAILGAAFVILGSITLALYCCPQAKENKPLDTLDQVSIGDARIKMLSS